MAVIKAYIFHFVELQRLVLVCILTLIPLLVYILTPYCVFFIRELYNVRLFTTECAEERKKSLCQLLKVMFRIAELLLLAMVFSYCIVSSSLSYHKISDHPSQRAMKRKKNSLRQRLKVMFSLVELLRLVWDVFLHYSESSLHTAITLYCVRSYIVERILLIVLKTVQANAGVPCVVLLYTVKTGLHLPQTCH